MNTYMKPMVVKDLQEQGRVILAHGEVTGHCHEVLASETDVSLPAMEYFEEPDGRRVLLVLRPCELRHQEHAPIMLDPASSIQVRQGDVLLNPLGKGAWEVVRQREYTPAQIRSVAD